MIDQKVSYDEQADGNTRSLGLLIKEAASILRNQGLAIAINPGFELHEEYRRWVFKLAGDHEFYFDIRLEKIENGEITLIRDHVSVSFRGPAGYVEHRNVIDKLKEFVLSGYLDTWNRYQKSHKFFDVPSIRLCPRTPDFGPGIGAGVGGGWRRAAVLGQRAGWKVRS